MTIYFKMTPEERASAERVNVVVTVVVLLSATIIVKAVCLLLNPWIFINF